MKCYGVEDHSMVLCDHRRELVVSPKPRRLCHHVLLPCFHTNNQTEMSGLKAGEELLDVILSKEKGVERSCKQTASSPPFFYGSPPCRVSNPVVQDKHFKSESIDAYSRVVALPASPSSSARKGGCVRMTFGQKSATVRIEGFDCLSRDTQNCNISAFA